MPMCVKADQLQSGDRLANTQWTLHRKVFENDREVGWEASMPHQGHVFYWRHDQPLHILRDPQ